VIHEYTPNEIKVAVAGDGGANKQQVITMVERLTHPTHPITHDDEYDAIATALTASATYRMVRCEK
jgi:Holliday junction resolvasome RuvABC endonuclease subunit